MLCQSRLRESVAPLPLCKSLVWSGDTGTGSGETEEDEEEAWEEAWEGRAITMSLCRLKACSWRRVFQKMT